MTVSNTINNKWNRTKITAHNTKNTIGPCRHQPWKMQQINTKRWKNMVQTVTYKTFLSLLQDRGRIRQTIENTSYQEVKQWNTKEVAWKCDHTQTLQVCIMLELCENQSDLHTETIIVITKDFLNIKMQWNYTHLSWKHARIWMWNTAECLQTVLKSIIFSNFCINHIMISH